jgi:hypothetical protein
VGRPGRSGAKPKYPWPEMKPGQQRVLSGNPSNIRAAACMWGKAHGAQFSTQTVECWLIVRRVK